MTTPPSSVQRHGRHRRSPASPPLTFLVAVLHLHLRLYIARAWTPQRQRQRGHRCRQIDVSASAPESADAAVAVGAVEPPPPSEDSEEPAPNIPSPISIFLTPRDANEELNRLLRAGDDGRAVVVALEGRVGKRRALGGSLAFLDARVADPADGRRDGGVGAPSDSIATAGAGAATVQALLRREFWTGDDDGDAVGAPSKSFDAYHKILQPGVRVLLRGRAGPSRNPGEAMLFVSTATYLGPNANPQHLRNVLKFARDGTMPAREAAEALGWDAEELRARLRGTAAADSNREDAARPSCGDLAREILAALKERRGLLDPSEIMGASDAGKSALLPPAPDRFVSPPEWARARDEDDSDSAAAPAPAEADPLSVAAVLDEHVRRSDRNGSARTPVTVSAWVQNRRRYGDSVTVLEAVDDFSAAGSSLRREGASDGRGAGGGGTGSDDAAEDWEDEMSLRSSRFRDLWKRRLYCVLHPSITESTAPPLGRGADATDGKSERPASRVYGAILCSGARALLRGYVAVDDENEPSCPSLHDGEGRGGDVATLWVTRARLLRSSWRPSVVRIVLDLLHSGELDAEEAAGALDLPGGFAQAEAIAAGRALGTVTERQWMAAELSRELQGESTRIGIVTEEMERALASYGGWRERFPLRDATRREGDDREWGRADADAAVSAASDASLDRPGAAAPPLRTSSSGSRWERAKRPQLQWMVAQIEEVVQSHPDCGARPLKVVDVGGGRGHLAILIAQHLGPSVADVHVVDTSCSAVRNGMMTARRRSLENVQYEAGDASAAVDAVRGVDIVVALHACGALSDVALGHAVSEGAGFVVCPCCYRSNPHLRVRIPSCEDSTELGTAAEWLDVDPDEYNALKSAAELQGDFGTAGRAMHTICALRAGAAERRYRDRLSAVAGYDEGGGTAVRWGSVLSVDIRTFPIGFSTRNLCIVGKISGHT